MRLNLISFGFKHGQPEKTDMMLDVRFLPNPHYVPDLKPYPGIHPDVASYILDNEAGKEFLTVLRPFINFVVSQYRNTDKEIFSIAIGCTGGKHRSVAVTEALSKTLTDASLPVAVTHRDMGKE